MMETNYEIENFKITGNWNLQSKILKEKYSLLKHSDLKLGRGQDNALIARIENTISKNRREVIQMMIRNVLA